MTGIYETKPVPWQNKYFLCISDREKFLTLIEDEHSSDSFLVLLHEAITVPKRQYAEDIIIGLDGKDCFISFPLVFALYIESFARENQRVATHKIFSLFFQDDAKMATPFSEQAKEMNHLKLLYEEKCRQLEKTEKKVAKLELEKNELFKEKQVFIDASLAFQKIVGGSALSVQPAQKTHLVSIKPEITEKVIEIDPQPQPIFIGTSGTNEPKQGADHQSKKTFVTMIDDAQRPTIELYSVEDIPYSYYQITYAIQHQVCRQSKNTRSQYLSAALRLFSKETGFKQYLSTEQAQKNITPRFSFYEKAFYTFEKHDGGFEKTTSFGKVYMSVFTDESSGLKSGMCYLPKETVKTFLDKVGLSVKFIGQEDSLKEPYQPLNAILVYLDGLGAFKPKTVLSKNNVRLVLPNSGTTEVAKKIFPNFCATDIEVGQTENQYGSFVKKVFGKTDDAQIALDKIAFIHTKKENND